MEKIIYYDQVGLIPGRQRWFNTQKSVTITHHINRLLHDQINRWRKAFDKVQHHFIIKSPKNLGIEKVYLNIIRTTYKKITASVI